MGMTLIFLKKNLTIKLLHFSLKAFQIKKNQNFQELLRKLSSYIINLMADSTKLRKKPFYSLDALIRTSPHFQGWSHSSFPYLSLMMIFTFTEATFERISLTNGVLYFIIPQKFNWSDNEMKMFRTKRRILTSNSSRVYLKFWIKG